VSGETNTLKAKISRNEQLIIIFEVVLYKVTKQNLSDQADHAASCSGTFQQQWKGERRRGDQIKYKSIEERNHNRMIEVVCEGRRFGDRTNENARDWL